MNRNSGLERYWLSIGLLAAVGCSDADKGTSATFDGDRSSSSTSDGAKNDGSGSQQGGRSGDTVATVMDAGSPDQHEIVNIEQPDATCAATSAEAPKVVVEKDVVIEVPHEEIKPVAIYLMLDRSSSMVGACNPRLLPACSAESWMLATGAISAFLRDPASADLNVALGYFPPLAQAATPADLCSGLSCGMPAVPMGRAAANAEPATASLNGAVPPNQFPFNSTPMECAIRGMSAFCKAHTQRTKEKCVGVLVTDGVPDGQCELNRDVLVQATATAAAEGTPIFTLGLAGTDYDFLNRVAMAGGTDCTPTDPMSAACNVSSGQAAFIAALTGIRDRVQVKETRVEKHTETVEVPLECEWNLPAPPDGMLFDKEKVNVTFSATGQASRTLTRVDSEADCAKGPDGWRYDSATAPKKVLACPQACEQIKSSPGARVSIAFGCRSRMLD